MIWTPREHFGNIWLSQLGQGEGATDIWWVESRGAAEHPTGHGTAPDTERPSQPPTPTVMRWENPALAVEDFYIEE